MAVLLGNKEQAVGHQCGVVGWEGGSWAHGRHVFGAVPRQNGVRCRHHMGVEWCRTSTRNAHPPNILYVNTFTSRIPPSIYERIAHIYLYSVSIEKKYTE